MSNHSYHHVLSAFMAKPWAILPEKLAVISEVIAMRLEGGKFTDEEIAERIEGSLTPEAAARKKKQPSYGGGGVAVIPITGVITPRADMFTEMSGGTAMTSFISAINQAANDTNVSSILLEVDSPGGQVDLVPEAAMAIRAARSKKPVTAVANTMAASAAYWLASQADEFIVSPSAEVGSIGVFAAHQDLSRALEAQGVKMTLVSAGKYKTELSPYEPLSDSARANVQATVDQYYSMFTKDVAAGRRVTVAAVRGGFGEGRMLISDNAVAANMADRVDTFDNTLYRMVSQAAKNGPKAELSDEKRFAAHITAEHTTPNEAREEEGLPEISGVTSHTPLLLTSGLTTTSSNADYTLNLWPEPTQATEAIIEQAVSNEFGTESDRPDAEPQESLTELRRKSRNAAISEREEYLSLLRRLT